MNFLDTLSNFIWGIPMLVLLVGTGVVLTFVTKGIQFRKFFESIKLAFFKKDDDKEPGDLTNLQALFLALSGTVGTGNIVGVSTAIALGGTGAIFWMWVSALFGMATKYAESLLAVKYRIVDENGEMAGGPMYYLQKGLNQKFLAVLFAVFTILASFGMGGSVQGNAISSALFSQFNVPYLWTAIGVCITSYLVLINGLKSIKKVVAVITPFMIAFYLITTLFIIVMNFGAVCSAIKLIFVSALSPESFTGGVVGSAIRYGLARGVFSNEAGLGSSPIAAACAKTKNPQNQALVAMLQVFIDTMIICSMTAVIVIMHGQYNNGEANVNLVIQAFNTYIGHFGGIIVSISLVLFAFSTICGWGYYGEKSICYLFGKKSLVPFRLSIIAFATLGASTNELVLLWNITDIFNGLMAFPNLIALIGLIGVIRQETK